MVAAGVAVAAAPVAVAAAIAAVAAYQIQTAYILLVS